MEKKLIFKTFFKTPFLRNIFLTCLVIIIVFPTYSVYVGYPSFTELLIANMEDDAIRTASHLKRTLVPENNRLSKLGYNVTVVSSGEEALEYVKKQTVDLMVIDMIMEPGIDGLETYSRILKSHPGQKAIITSGFSETDRVKEAQRLGAGSYIKKPYTLESIGIAIKEKQGD